MKAMTERLDNPRKATRQNADRAVESFGAWSRGWQKLADETAEFSKQSLQHGAAHWEKLLAARSIDAAFEAQADFLRTSYERAVGQAARFGEIYLDFVKDAAKPFEAPLSGAAK
jgi:phasin family protein